MRPKIEEAHVQAAASFAELARCYIALVDRVSTLTAHAFLTECARLLPLVYAAGISLPEVEPDDDSDSASKARVASPMGPLAALLGDRGFYHEVFDPVFDEQAIGASIPDDLADIYTDLANPLRAFEDGDITEALWAWRFNMHGHCGDHHVDCLRPIHRLFHDHMPHDWGAPGHLA